MELRSTGNPDTRNQVTMSMLEYLAKKGREAVSEKQTFGDKIRSMSDEELAKFLSEFSACNVCEYYDPETHRCDTDSNFLCVKAYAEAIIGDWLKQPVEE